MSQTMQRIPNEDVLTTSSGRTHKVPARFQLDSDESSSPSPLLDLNSASSSSSTTVTRTPNNKLALHIGSIADATDVTGMEDVTNKRKRTPNSKYIDSDDDGSTSEKKETPPELSSDDKNAQKKAKEVARRKLSEEYRKIMAPQHEVAPVQSKRSSYSRGSSPHHSAPAETSFRFPSFPDNLPMQPLEESFAPFFAQTDRSLDVNTLSKVQKIKTSLSPSSQPLHSIRLQIYKELSEEYFGRYMKETSETGEDEHTRAVRGAQRMSGRVAKSVNDRKETPEQLRMIFFEQYNKSEGDRVPSSAGCSSKTGIVMVNPLPTNQYLKSLSASHAASLSQLAPVGTVGPTEFFPSTLNSFQSSHPTRKGNRSAPTAMNPHFDLFQYAPTVITDQYEEIYDEIDQQIMQASAEHPTLPQFDENKPHIQQSETVAEERKTPEPVQTNQTQSAVEITPEPGVDEAMPAVELPMEPTPAPADITHDAANQQGSEPNINDQGPPGSVKVEPREEKSHVKPNSRPLYEIANPFIPQLDQPAPDSAVTNGCLMSDIIPSVDNGGVDSAPPVKIESEPAAEGASADASETFVNAAATNGSEEASDVLMIESNAFSPQSARKRGRPKKNKFIGGYASNNNMPSAPSASFEFDSIALPTKTVLSLPSTKHGVGMFGGLDFNSPHCEQFKSHWTNGCYSWKFDPKSKLFTGFAYTDRSANKEDVTTVNSILRNAQADFHHQLVADELDEQSFEDSLTASGLVDEPHAKRVKRQIADEDTSDAEESKGEAPNGSSAMSHRYNQTGAYSVGSPEYNSLKNRIRSSFEDSMHRSLFLPHTYLKEVAPRLHGHAIRMSQECVKDLYQKFHVERDEEDMDEALKLIIPGFGCRGTQVFLKIGLCVTLLHDEIAWCSALNYMTVRSRGCALWIGLNVHKASVKWPKEKIRHLINATNFNLCEFLAQMKKSGLQPSLQLQYPGTCIYSPQGRGSAHIVITVGSWVEQIAINHGMSPSGIRAAMSFWDGVPPLLHNSALATRCVVPLLWLQKFKNWELGMGEQLCVLAAIESQVNAEPSGSHKIAYRNYNNVNDQEMYCQKCFNQHSNRRAILFMSIDGMCPACFVDAKPDYAHFANMLDRRLK